LHRLIHGGAWDIPHDLHDAHAQGYCFLVRALSAHSHTRTLGRCAAAYAAACAAHAAGADGLSIVIAALDVLEEDWTFDAGKDCVNLLHFVCLYPFRQGEFFE
jgi:isoaspartyl peptidase/L-asparaginase-like protein (Ntn-hydrolase superfamily)